MFEEIPHTGEVAFRIWGEKIEELVRDSANALFYLYFGKKPEELPPSKSLCKKEIEVDGIDIADAIISFINELIYIFDTKHLVCREILSVLIDKEKSRIKVSALFDSTESIPPSIYVKAATRGGAELKEEKINSKTIYSITIIFDI